MCSRLTVKLGVGWREVSLGDPIPYQPSDGDGQVHGGRWGTYFGTRLIGFARVETFKATWLPKGWQPCRVPIIDFAEGHETVIWAGQKDVDLGALYHDGDVVIITRQASAREHTQLQHHRVPVQVVDGHLVLAGGLDWLQNTEKQ